MQLEVSDLYIPALIVAIVPLSAFTAWLYFLNKEQQERIKKGI